MPYVAGLSIQTDDFRLNAGNANDSGWLDNGIRTSGRIGKLSARRRSGRVAGRYADNRHPQRRMLGSGRPPVAAIPEKRIRLAGSRPSDWTQVVAGRIACTGGLPDARNKKLKIDSVWIGNVEIGSFKNRQIPQKQRIKPLFYQSLQKLSFGVEVRRISFSDIRAVYEELSATGTVPVPSPSTV